MANILAVRREDVSAMQEPRDGLEEEMLLCHLKLQLYKTIFARWGLEGRPRMQDHLELGVRLD